MTEYIATRNADTWVKLDGRRAQVLSRKELLSQQRDLKAQLAELPGEPTDAELLKWARDNYPALSNTARSRRLIEDELARIDADLAATKAVVEPIFERP